MQISRPWPGNYVGDAGPYDGAQWSRRFGARYVDTTQDNRGGVIGGSFMGLHIEPMAPPSMAVVVRAGSAFVCDRWYHNNLPIILPIAANTSGLVRFDRVVLRKRWVEGTIRAVVLTGVPSKNDAQPPALTQNDGIQWEISLAVIEVASGAVAINAADITDEREFIKGRRYLLGVADFETDLAVNTATITAFGGTDDRAWELTFGGNDEIFSSVVTPAEWGNNRLACQAYVWVYSANAVPGDYICNFYRLDYASGDVAANLVIGLTFQWPSLTGPKVQRVPVGVAGVPTTFFAWPRHTLEIAIQQWAVVSTVWIVGTELYFWRI